MTPDYYENLFGSIGKLAAKLPRYEFREAQLEMAMAISRAIEKDKHLVVEAGTGIGKSFAYLIPFVEWTVSHDRRVVISTYTKALQEQLAKKDVPFLQESLGFKFIAALCFGGENYLCRWRLYRGWQQGLFENKREASEVGKIMEWAQRTQTGLRMELPFEPLESVWFRVCRESDLCRGKRCSLRQECFYAKAREKQQLAHVLIANHHLFFANIASGMQIMPSFDGVVFDEAHNLEDVAAHHLGFELSNTQLNYLLQEFHHPRHETGFFHRLKELKDKAELLVLTNAARQAGEVFFDGVLNVVEGKSVIRLREPHQFENVLTPTLEQMADAVTEKIEHIKDEEDRDELVSHVLRLRAWGAHLHEFVAQQREHHVYWVEAQERHRGIKCTLCTSPIDVAPHLKKLVFDEMSPIVLTSATLAVAGKFDFIRTRLGLDRAEELLLHSPFDFEHQVLLYVPTDMPDPVRSEVDHVAALGVRIEHLVNITEGRSFVLFTSYQTLNCVYESVSERLLDFNLLKQGELPRWQLVDQFKKGERTVLFGTSTFWQGIDVPGSALECVIITRLPFAVPNHPLVEARIMDMEEKGEDAFMGYQVPSAVLLFKQGFGRLIRHRKDIGIVAILDPRVKTRGYGRAFLNSLPICRELDEIEELGKAYNKLKHNVV